MNPKVKKTLWWSASSVASLVAIAIILVLIDQLIDLLPVRDTSAMVTYLENGDLESAKKCFAAGADINGHRKEGWSSDKHDGTTPLNAAMNSGSVKAVKWVIENGADVNKEKGSGYPIVLAAFEGNLQIVKELEKAGVNFDVEYAKLKPSELAERAGNSEDFVEYLRERENRE